VTSARAPLVEVERLRVSYLTPRGPVPAVNDASLEIRHGEAVGLVGESGSGKSTVARALLGLLPRRTSRIDGGRILVDGLDVTQSTRRDWERLRGSPVAIVFQDPSSFLNPVMRVGRQIAESVIRHDPAVAAGARVAELLDLVRLPQGCARSYPHELSGGMRQRVLLAIALGCRPRLLIADEPTTALDVTTQAEILALLGELRLRLNMALLLISHDLAVVSSACSRISVMYGGYTVEGGTAEAVFARPAHPYTAALMQAAELARDGAGRFVTIADDRRGPVSGAAGCPFSASCPRAVDPCVRAMPEVTFPQAGDTHAVRCWAAA
jgi:oligopeptide/dipeptide ABC transporter ATP-binding protein